MTEAAQKLGTLLEGIIGVDAGGRGLARVPGRNLLTNSSGHLCQAGSLLAQSSSPCLLIVTGFPILAADPPGTGETDGPPGAIALARSAVAAGGRAILASEGSSARALAVAITHLRLKDSVTVVDMAGLPQGDFEGAMRRRVGKFTHLVAVERVGPTHSESTFSTWAGSEFENLLPEFRKAAPPEACDRACSPGTLSF